MNYLRHLNGFFERLDQDKRLSSYHISLYLALFRQWNACRFSDRFVVSRAETMELARIGSANTYARCMKELTDWGYIHYNASSNLHCGSTVSCIRFDTETGTAFDIESGTGSINDTADHPGNSPIPNTNLPSDINTDTAAGTASDTTADTGTPGSLKSNTTGNTATDTGTENDTATDTGADAAGNTGTSGGTENDTKASTAGDTGIASGRRYDTATGTGNRENNPAGIKSGTGGDTASDTLLINITNKNKQEENQKKKKNRKEKEKSQNRQSEKNPGAEEKERTEIPDFSKVASYFEQNHFPQIEAQQFYARYLSSGWKTGNNQQIVSWQALARKWMTNNNKNNSHERTFNQIGAGRLSARTDKDYSEPL
ncbi:MAG: hypothetical protein AB2L20_19050 [Mangrovibacterium sp.]